MGPRAIKDSFHLYFQTFPKIARVKKRREQFWENFLFLIKPLSIPNSASPSRNVFSARGLVTLLL